MRQRITLRLARHKTWQPEHARVQLPDLELKLDDVVGLLDAFQIRLFVEGDLSQQEGIKQAGGLRLGDGNLLQPWSQSCVGKTRRPPYPALGVVADTGTSHSRANAQLCTKELT